MPSWESRSAVVGSCCWWFGLGCADGGVDHGSGNGNTYGGGGGGSHVVARSGVGRSFRWW